MKKDKLPERIAKLKDTCFVCGSKWCRICGGAIVKKPEIVYDNKKQYVIFRFAPLGCYLAHNKKAILSFYKDKELIKILKKRKNRKMYCRKCLNKGKKVNMQTKTKEGEYVCPKCNHKVKWHKK